MVLSDQPYPAIVDYTLRLNTKQCPLISVLVHRASASLPIVRVVAVWGIRR